MSAVTLVSGIFALLVSAVMLLVILKFEKVAQGGAMGENMSYLYLGVVCLAFSVLIGFVGNFLPEEFSVEQAAVAADLLVALAMFFFILYFNNIRVRMMSFVKYARSATTEQLQAQAEGADQAGPGGSGVDDAPGDEGDTQGGEVV